MKQEKAIFFKTVRHDGSSVWAPKGLSRIYRMGERYKFPDELPAHVFIATVDAYRFRPEADGGSRVLVCYGNLDHRLVPCLEYTFSPEGMRKRRAAYRYVSTDFVVIGELKRQPDFRTGEMPIAARKISRSYLAKLRRFGRSVLKTQVLGSRKAL